MEPNKLQFWRRFVSLENAPFAILATLLVVVPLIFSFSQFVSFFYMKSLTVSFGVLLAAMVSILAFIKAGSIPYPKNLFGLSFGFLILATLVSSVLSSSVVGSLLGYGYEITTFSSLLVLVLLAYLVSVSFTNKNRLFSVLTAFVIFSGLMSLFHLARLLFGAGFLSLGIFTSIGTNTIGSLNELAVLFGATTILSFLTLEILKLKAAKRIIAYVVLCLSLGILVILNFTLVWYVVGVIAVVFFVLAAAHSFASVERKIVVSSDSVPAIAPEKEVSARPRLAVKALAVAIIAMVFVLPLGQELGASLATRFELSTLEIRPSWSATYDVFKANLKEDPAFGIGPNRFSVAWQLYRPDVNSSDFWDANFSSAIGLVPTFVIETGLVGLVAWLFFLVSFVLFGVRAMFSAYQDRMSRFLVTSTFAVAAFFWTMNILYSPGFVIVFLTFFFTGLFIAALSSSGVSILGAFAFVERPRVRFIATMTGVILLVATAGFAYTLLEQARAATYYQRALVSAVRGNDLGASETYLLNAIRLSDRDVYYRSLSQLNLSKIDALISSASGQEDVSEEQRSQFQISLANAVESARFAQMADPLRLENQMAVAQVYATVVPIGIEGAFDAAKMGYEEALRVSPRNPGIHLALAQVAAANKDIATAESYIQKSLELKPNYTDALLFQAQIDVSLGKLAQAVTRVEQIAAITPNDPVVYFRLGLLEYDSKDYKAATAAFERAVVLVPEYANAKYFLGLSYASNGERAKALSVFESLLSQNPENTELSTIVSNLKSGRAPLSSTGVDDTDPEKRQDPPTETESE